MNYDSGVNKENNSEIVGNYFRRELKRTKGEKMHFHGQLQAGPL